MRVWVDADACPTVIRDLILRASGRLNVPAVFVANRPIGVPVGALVTFVEVKDGPDAADAYIAANAQSGDLAVTQDIPLAAQLVPQGVVVMSPRGDSYNSDNIADKLSRRDLLQELRDVGEISGGPRPFDDKLKRKFANLFDAALHRLLKAPG